MTAWTEQYLSSNKLEINSTPSLLIERAISNGSGTLSSQGALVVKSGKFTGRAAKDKYVVEDDYSMKVIDWERSNSPFKKANYSLIKEKVLKHINSSIDPIYIVERSAGADESLAIGIRLISTSPYHALFAEKIFRPFIKNPPLGNFTIIHAPNLELDATEYGIKSKTTAIILDFSAKEIIIYGTGYCGEIKKSIFTVMNTLLPDRNILPMHSGASLGQDGKTSIFFGLSGTGKTTLSTDVGMNIIGDDEHGLSDKGIFNFEGGCYAKTYQLNKTTEPQIYQASTTFGSLLENVVLDEERHALFDDNSITENGRATYPLSSLESYVPEGRGPIPSNIFFLSADALGVLPAISKLNPEQAMYFFLSGYTAKLAGTEVGAKGISATFSHCFGAPFMIRRPADYGLILKDFLAKHSINVWLVNTGWYGGPYGVGKRYSLPFTRSCIRAVQQGKGSQASFQNENTFKLKIPTLLGTVDQKFLNPRDLWSSSEEYDKAAKELKHKFDENYKTLGQQG